MNTFIRIIGDEERGSEIISKLEKLGGINTYLLHGSNREAYYFINYDGNICTVSVNYCTPFFIANYTDMTLEELKRECDIPQHFKTKLIELNNILNSIL